MWLRVFCSLTRGLGPGRDGHIIGPAGPGPLGLAAGRYHVLVETGTPGQGGGPEQTLGCCPVVTSRHTHLPRLGLTRQRLLAAAAEVHCLTLDAGI